MRDEKVTPFSESCKGYSRGCEAGKQLELFQYRLPERTPRQDALREIKRGAVAVGIAGLNGNRNSLRFARLLFVVLPELRFA